MRLDRIPDSGLPLIQGYGDNGFRISGARVEGAVLVCRTGAETVGIEACADIATGHVAPLTEAGGEERPELLLVGAGPEPGALPEAVRAALSRAGIGVEVMGTGAACRTYNVLVAEGRRVAALLLPVP